MIHASQDAGLGAYVPPHNIEAEQSTLGAMLIDRAAILPVRQVLQPQDFYRETHQRLCSVIYDLDDRETPVDLITVQEELKNRNLLDDIGGMSYLTSLFDTVPTAANAEHYAGIVQGKSILRGVMDFAFYAIGRARGEVDDLPAIINEIQERAYGLGGSAAVQDEVIPMAKFMARVYDKAEIANETKGTVGLRTGLSEYDKLIGGFDDDTLNIIAGRPGMGKTVLADDIIEYNADRMRPMLIVTLEMSGEQLALRCMSKRADINSRAIREGDLDMDGFEALANAIESMWDLPYLVADMPGAGLARIQSVVRRTNAQLRRQGKVGLSGVILDYIQIMEPDSKHRGNDAAAIAHNARGLKNLARELHIPLFALAQLNRNVEMRQDKRPMLMDLRQSGQLEAEADTITFLYRQAYYDAMSGTPSRDTIQETELIAPKVRNGSPGYCKVGFEPVRTRFVNLATGGMFDTAPTGF